jgi:hypothetical protein
MSGNVEEAQTCPRSRRAWQSRSALMSVRHQRLNGALGNSARAEEPGSYGANVLEVEVRITRVTRLV